VLGWITVSLSLGPEGCKVEVSLGGSGLEVDGAGLGSGGRVSRQRTLGIGGMGPLPMGMGPISLPMWRHLRRKKTERGF